MCRASHLNKRQDRVKSVFASSPQYRISIHSLQKYLQMQNNSLPRKKKKPKYLRNEAFIWTWPFEKNQRSREETALQRAQSASSQ